MTPRSSCSADRAGPSPWPCARSKRPARARLRWPHSCWGRTMDKHEGNAGAGHKHVTRDGFEILDQCHRDTLGALETMAQLVALLEVEGDSERVREMAGDVVKFFSTTARHHHEDEERHVFPKALVWPRRRDRAGRAAPAARPQLAGGGLDGTVAASARRWPPATRGGTWRSCARRTKSLPRCSRPHGAGGIVRLPTGSTHGCSRPSGRRWGARWRRVGAHAHRALLMSRA